MQDNTLNYYTYSNFELHIAKQFMQGPLYASYSCYGSLSSYVVLSKSQQIYDIEC